MAKAKPVSSAPVQTLITLAMIVAAGENGLASVPLSVYQPLAASGLVEVNSAAIEPNGNAPVRATAAGVAQVNGAPVPDPKPAATGGYSIDSGIEVPAISGRGRGASTVYPFEQMEIGNSFFVPATAERPDPAKQLASTVSAATARYQVAKEPAEYKQVVNAVYAKGPDGKLARDAEGKLIKTGERTDTVQVMVQIRKFMIRGVTEKGVAGARIWRVAV